MILVLRRHEPSAELPPSALLERTERRCGRYEKNLIVGPNVGALKVVGRAKRGGFQGGFKKSNQRLGEKTRAFAYLEESGRGALSGSRKEGYSQG